MIYGRWGEVWHQTLKVPISDDFNLCFNYVVPFPGEVVDCRWPLAG